MAATVYEILCDLGYQPKDFGNHYRMAALYRHGSNRMSLCVRKRDGMFVDFGGKKEKGSFKTFLKLAIGDKPEVIKKYLQDVEISSAEFVPKQDIKREKIYPESVLLSLLPHWDYFTNAGISIDTLKIFKVGLAQKGKMLRRYVFPIYNIKGEIIGFTGRWYQKVPPSEETAKWKHLGDKRSWVWPLHLNKEIIQESEEVILVESPNCVLHLWEQGIRNVLCMFGTELSPKLLKYLLSLTKLKRIIIATNNEPDNTDDYSPEGIGNAAAKVIEKKLLKWFAPEKVLVKLPPQKDFADCTPEEIQGWHKSLDDLPYCLNLGYAKGRTNVHNY